MVFLCISSNTSSLKSAHGEIPNVTSHGIPTTDISRQVCQGGPGSTCTIGDGNGSAHYLSITDSGIDLPLPTPIDDFRS